jgi:hypothetical protein
MVVGDRNCYRRRHRWHCLLRHKFGAQSRRKEPNRNGVEKLEHERSNAKNNGAG